MRSILLALPVLAAAASPASATGGFSCMAGDDSLRFAAESGMSRGMGGVLLGFRARLDITLEGMSEELKSLTLDDALTQSWIDGKSIKLQFYTERPDEPFRSVDFIVETAAVDEGAYRGHYRLTVFDTPSSADADREMWTAEGYATCYAE